MAKRKLDEFSADYTKYLRANYELEAQMLLDRAEYEPGKPEAYQKTIGKRIGKLAEIGDAQSRFVGSGVSRSLTLPPPSFPQSFFPPYEVPVPFVVDREVCDLNQTLNIADYQYFALDQDHSFTANPGPGKRVWDRAGANPNHSDWDTSGRIHNGFQDID